MRVGMVTSAFEPEIGGIESHVRHLSDALGRAGCDVEIITQCPHGKASSWGRAEQTTTARVLRFDDVTRTKEFRVSPSLWSYLRNEEGRYDIVHAHNFHAFPALAAATAGSGPLVFTPHFHATGHSAAAKLLHVPYRKAAGRIFRRTSTVICVSSAERHLFESVYPQYSDLVRVLGTGINGEEIVRSDPYDIDLPVVLTGGRLEGYKRVDLVVEAFAHIAQSAILAVAGGGPAEARIRARVDELGVADRVRLLGRVDSDVLRRWQRTARVVVSMSTREAFGLSLAEAAVAGCFIVASDIPAHREVSELAGDASGLVPVDANPSEVAAALLRGIEMPKRAAGQYGFPTWDAVAKETIEVYRSAAKTSR